jgi:hypothetical protein
MGNKLFEALDQAAAALKVVTASTLSPDLLASSTATLKGIPVNDLIEEFTHALPAESDDPKVQDDRSKELDRLANDLNKKVDAVNDELTRIKSMRSTLNLEALDPVIHAAQHVVRPIYNLSANLRG